MRLGQLLGLAAHQKRHAPPASWSNTYSVDGDGSDDHVECATGSDIDFLSSSGGTLSYWVKFDAINGSGINAIGISTSTKSFYMGCWGTGYTYGGLPNSGANYATISPALSTGSWYMFTLTGTSGGTIKTYVNASEKGSGSWTPDASKDPVDNFFIGGTNSGSAMANGIDGHVDEVGIWTEALDADAITAIYNSGTPIDLTEDSGNYDNSDTLWGYWRCGDNNGGTGSTVTDQGSGENNGTFRNQIAFASDVPS